MPRVVCGTKAGRGPGGLRALPRGVWALGFVSMHMDVSSELVHSILPVFMSVTLGASMRTIGLVEGTAEAAAAITKVFSGLLSDYFGRRKGPTLLGYGLAALTKPVFPLAGSIGWVFAARFTDRIGKGIRGAPRDALIADITPSEMRGAAYGLRQALDSVGAFVGPALAVLALAAFAGDMRKALWVAVVPAVLAVAILFLFVREPAGAARAQGAHSPLRLTAARELPRRYWLVVSVGAAFSLARFSEAFLVLRAKDVGLAVSYVPLVFIVMNVVFAATAYPAGAASDRIGVRGPFLAGLSALVCAHLLLAAAAGPGLVLAGSALWGMHMGLTQGLFGKLIAAAAPRRLRATGFGAFNFVNGISLFAASALAGTLWTAYGAKATFIAGAAFAAAAAAGILIWTGGGAGEQGER